MDAVITWVDGTDVTFRKKMQDFMGATSDLTADMQYNERCISDNEIVGCIAGIQRYAPWIENIYIVTDEQDPISKFPEIGALGDNIKVIDLKVIYRGFEDALPNFNSNSIECLLWRIPGLSEHFMYFNDDMMLINDLKEVDVVDNGLPVLNFVSRRPASRRRPEGFVRYHYMKNTQKIMNKHFEKEPAYLPRHFPAVWSKSLFDFFFQNLREDFLEVVYTQKRGDYKIGFFPGMLHHNWLKATTDAKLNFHHVGVFINGNETEEEINQKMEGLEDEKSLFLCVNNLRKTQNDHPDFIDALRKRVGF